MKQWWIWCWELNPLTFQSITLRFYGDFLNLYLQEGGEEMFEEKEDILDVKADKYLHIYNNVIVFLQWQLQNFYLYQ